jgi:hypothetical protein
MTAVSALPFPPWAIHSLPRLPGLPAHQHRNTVIMCGFLGGAALGGQSRLAPRRASNRPGGLITAPVLDPNRSAESPGCHIDHMPQVQSLTGPHGLQAPRAGLADPYPAGEYGLTQSLPVSGVRQRGHNQRSGSSRSRSMQNSIQASWRAFSRSSRSPIGEVRYPKNSTWFASAHSSLSRPHAQTSAARSSPGHSEGTNLASRSGTGVMLSGRRRRTLIYFTARSWPCW